MWETICTSIPKWFLVKISLLLANWTNLIEIGLIEIVNTNHLFIYSIKNPKVIQEWLKNNLNINFIIKQ